MSIPLLSVKHLTTDIHLEQGKVRAVRDVSFDLWQGKTIGIVGESGCGKSILCKSILKLLPAYAHILEKSQIIFNGRSINNLTEKELNKIRGQGAAMIFQDPLSSLNPVMKIGHQVTETLLYHLKMEEEPALKKAEDLLKAVGIANPSQRIDQYPHQLSGGLRQRVAIAIALACEPKLLIADEPTTALDVTVQAEILDLLDHLQIQRNMAMILVTHDFGLAACRADEIAVMYGGKIVEYAPAEKLLANPRMPYTKALINAIPRLEDPPHTPLQFIEGQPPNMMIPYAGCCFAPRCSLAGHQCRDQEPLLINDDTDDHSFACWNPLGKIS
ncbi:MAG: ABC transporter ATP-binding protein [Desulfobacteraceae bacterium]|nr:ABC transporter ATP-binding protein [Desulfobacteraceae bacterium]